MAGVKTALNAAALGWSILGIFFGLGWLLSRYHVSHAADLVLGAALVTVLLVGVGGKD
jgi:hypothetical protein